MPRSSGRRVADDFTERYGDLLTGSYGCVDRIVLNAYYPIGIRERVPDLVAAHGRGQRCTSSGDDLMILPGGTRAALVSGPDGHRFLAEEAAALRRLSRQPTPGEQETRMMSHRTFG